MRRLVALALAVISAVPAMAQDLADKVEAQVRPILDNGLVPGLVVGVIHDGEAQVFGFGSLKVGGVETPDGDTIYEIGSISKVFTSVLLADASNRGVLGLDDTIAEHTPEGVTPPSYTREGGEKVVPTLTQLATHHSGLPRLPANLGVTTDENPYAAYDREKLWSFLDGFSIPVEPGSGYAYSNLATGLLGTIVADASDESYGGLLRERVCEALGMDDTTASLREAQRDRLAPGTTGGVIEVPNWDFDAMAGAGAIRSTVDDMLLLAEAGLEPPDSEIGRAIAISMERRETLPERMGGDPSEGNGAGLGLGWHFAMDGTTRWHNGQTGGYKAYMGINRELEAAVVVLANGTASEVDQVAERILQLLGGMSPEPVDVRESVSVADGELARLEGTYLSNLGFAITVTHKADIDGQGNGALLTQVTGQPTFRIWAESPTRFFYREVPAEIEFKVPDDAEKPESLTLFQSGREMVCRRAVKKGE